MLTAFKKIRVNPRNPRHPRSMSVFKSQLPHYQITQIIA